MKHDDAFPCPSMSIRDQALSRQMQLSKPTGSLGRLEELAVTLAGWFGDPLPQTRPAEALLFAADHGVSRLGVSAYPREVTRAMVLNFLRGGAAACVLARYHRIPLTVIDVGVAGEKLTWEGPGYRRAAVADAPSGDLATTDAMDDTTLDAALQAGKEAMQSVTADTRVVVLGDMGIGNTTVASALAAGLLGGDAEQWVGRGTGVDDSALQLKREVVTRALMRVGHEPRAREVLRRVGGREIAAIAGAMIEAARLRRVVLVDGFIVTAAALAATRMEPRVRPALLFAHRSAEAAHDRMLDALSARPLLDLEMRLGEGSGALAAFSLLEMACRLHCEMATFAAAGVPEKSA
jgi:nicotinate-nucleotide--dimethylbenzimidazole phosphoribosyltransferase